MNATLSAFKRGLTPIDFLAALALIETLCAIELYALLNHSLNLPMNDTKENAVRLLRYYLSHIVEKTQAWKWDDDNDCECKQIVESILAVAKEEADQELQQLQALCVSLGARIAVLERASEPAPASTSAPDVAPTITLRELFHTMRPDLTEDALVRVTDSEGDSFTATVRELNDTTMEAILKGLPTGAFSERILVNP